MHVTGKYLQGLMRPVISEGSFKSTKPVYYLTCLAINSSKIFVSFCSLNSECTVSRAFAYNAVNIN